METFKQFIKKPLTKVIYEPISLVFGKHSQPKKKFQSVSLVFGKGSQGKKLNEWSVRYAAQVGETAKELEKHYNFGKMPILDNDKEGYKKALDADAPLRAHRSTISGYTDSSVGLNKHLYRTEGKPEAGYKPDVKKMDAMLSVHKTPKPLEIGRAHV